jgi:ArsR family transcriptional regulator, arsenate/arsenite/antimonite-responsive transcriptional repressor
MNPSLQSITGLYKLLSDETRLRILMLLIAEPLCVCELCGILSQPQPKVSKNLAKLRDMGIVTDERREKFVFYRLTSHSAYLIKLLSDLSDDLVAYPRLLEDRERLVDKEKYLTLCTLNLE